MLKTHFIGRGGRKHIDRTFSRIVKQPAWILAVVLFLAGCVEEPKPVQQGPKLVKMQTLVAENFLEARTFPARVEAAQEADLSFRVSGPLKELPVQAGQEVKKGGLIAKIDQRDFLTRVESVQSSLDGARAELAAMRKGARDEEINQLKAQIDAAQAKYDDAKTDYDRFKTLLAEKVVSQSEFDQKEARYKVADSNLKAAKEALRAGETGARKEDVDAKEADIRRLESQFKEARDALKDTELVAPFDGNVARIMVDNFEDVQAKQPIVHLQNLTELHIVVDVSESDLARVGAQGGKSMGEIVETAKPRVIFDGYPDDDFPAYFKEFETEANPETQTYKLTLVMSKPNIRVGPGMSATVKGEKRLKGITKPGDFLVLASALDSDASGNPRIWVYDPKTSKATPFLVVMSEMEKDSVWIIEKKKGELKELKAGMIIVVSAVSLLDKEMEVKPMPDYGEI